MVHNLWKIVEERLDFKNFVDVVLKYENKYMSYPEECVNEQQLVHDIVMQHLSQVSRG